MTQKERMRDILERAYAEGYAAGHGAALASLDVKPSEEEKQEVLPKVSIPSTHNVENSLVQRFMADTYPDGYAVGDGLSKVDKYRGEVVEGSVQSWTEKSNPLTVGSKGQTVRLTLDGKTTEYDGGAPIYNLIPGKTYACEVLDAKGNSLGKGNIRTTGKVRMIAMDDENCIVNIRDAGGYGGMAYGRCLRSAYLPTGLKYASVNARILRDLGVTVEIDLRGTAARSDLGWKGYRYGSNGYSLILTKPTNLKTELTLITSTLEAGGCVLFHCHAGADRTGTLAAILQLLCGASEDEVIHDWELTSFCCWYNFKRISDEEKNKEEYPYGELRTFFRNLSKYTGDTWKDKMIYWLVKKVGVSSSLIARLQKCLMD